MSVHRDKIQRRGSRKTCAEVEGTGGGLVAAEDVAGIYFVLDVAAAEVDARQRTDNLAVLIAV